MHITLNKDQTFQLKSASDEETAALINLAIKHIMKHIVIFDVQQMEKVQQLMMTGSQLDYEGKITTTLESEDTLAEDEASVKKPTRNNYH